jgi:hypothetical protein
MLTENIPELLWSYYVKKKAIKVPLCDITTRKARGELQHLKQLNKAQPMVSSIVEVDGLCLKIRVRVEVRKVKKISIELGSAAMGHI